MATLMVSGVRLTIDNPDYVRSQLQKLNEFQGGLPGPPQVFWGHDDAGKRTWVMVPAGVAVAVQD